MKIEINTVDNDNTKVTGWMRPITIEVFGVSIEVWRQDVESPATCGCCEVMESSWFVAPPSGSGITTTFRRNEFGVFQDGKFIDRFDTIEDAAMASSSMVVGFINAEEQIQRESEDDETWTDEAQRWAERIQEAQANQDKIAAAWCVFWWRRATENMRFEQGV